MSKTKGGLGRGLGALIPDLNENIDKLKKGDEAAAGEAVYDLPLADILPNPWQPRHEFDEEALTDLADSIRREGVLSPILVVRREGDTLLVSGERRLRAAKIAGLETIPAIVRQLDDRAMATIALVENIQRADLNALEEAQGYARLMADTGQSAAQVAEAVGKSRAHVANMVRLLDLPEEVLALLAEGRLTAGHGRALLGIPDPADLVALALEAAQLGYSVRQVEELARSLKDGNKPDADRKKPAKAAKGQEVYQEISRQLSENLQTKVRIHKRGPVSELKIEFYSEDDLTRILELLHQQLH
ncbi:MAG: ParB/RepB/Spo0J family partition protein [Peptococcus niger]|nr:ParB/RepB/Spo0J family partition protein [Clostridiales bacterium]MDU1028624.1 ParB/RepB/Spo0J family partition protein [Clostridiales bacterium]MDU2292695.1 ParB/RepB/Spo0J family partition protein [Peptococcus niger]